MKKKKNKIDLNKINVRGIVAVTIAIGIVCFEMYIRIFPLVKLTHGDNYCEIYRKDDYIREYYLKDTQKEEIIYKLYCCKFDFDGDINKCIYQMDME